MHRLCFINRRLPVPQFDHQVTDKSHKLTIKTDALTLIYSPTGDGRFTPTDLSMSLTVDGKPVTWKPGVIDPQNLKGTTRTLDGALGNKTRSHRQRLRLAQRLGR